MALQQPAWFVDVDAWWLPAVGRHIAVSVTPLGLDERGRLHVECSTSAWQSQMKLLQKPLVAALNRQVREVEFTGIISSAYPSVVPQLVHDNWAEIVGADLTDQVRPAMLGRRGAELVTIAVSVEARDEALRRSSLFLDRINKLLGPGCTITSWPLSSLEPVVVVIAASPDWQDRRLVETTLLQTWHDAVEAFGVERTFAIDHTSETAADSFVDEWARQSHGILDDSLPGLIAMGFPAQWRTHFDKAPLRRDQELVSRRPDLCLAFVTDPTHPPRLATLAEEAGIPVWRVTS